MRYPRDTCYFDFGGAPAREPEVKPNEINFKTNSFS